MLAPVEVSEIEIGATVADYHHGPILVGDYQDRLEKVSVTLLPHVDSDAIMTAFGQPYSGNGWLVVVSVSCGRVVAAANRDGMLVIAEFEDKYSDRVTRWNSPRSGCGPVR